MMATAKDCLERIRKAAAGASKNAAERPLTDDELLEIAERIEARRKGFEAAGKIDGIGKRMAAAAKEEADKVRIAAALQRRHAMMNAIVRGRLEDHLSAALAAKLSPRDAVLSIYEGSVRPFAGARKSVAATRLAYEARYMGDMMARISKERPHILARLDDERLMADAVREMYEIKPAGNRGVSGDPDARYLAETFAAFAEVSRRDLNRLGGNIGRLDGWSPQMHDAAKVGQVTAEAWVNRIWNHLDMARTLPDVTDVDRAGEILQDIYRSIVTGRDNTITAREKGETIGPANLARSLEKHRVLHFKSADDWLAYQAEFGAGNLFSTMIGHQRRAARLAAQMEIWGPNPQVMTRAVMASLQRRIRNDNLIPDIDKAAMIRALDADAFGSAIGAADAEMTGLTLAPVNITAARISSGIRAVQSMAKLGGAVISAIATDPVTMAANLQFQGQSLWKAYPRLLTEFLSGRGKGEQRELAFLIGEGFDGLIDHVITPWVAQDDVPGRMSKLLSTFFRWTGLSWETDAMRAAGGRMVAAWLGQHAGSAHGALPERLRHVLGLHGIGEREWSVLQQLEAREIDGRRYLTPELVHGLSDGQVRPLIPQAEIDAKKAALKIGAAKTPATEAKREQAFRDWLARRSDQARLDLELALRRYYADEVSFGHIETDEASRRWTVQGTRPGTAIGEAMRFVMQFKGFPLAFTRRVLGRAIYQQPGATRADRLLNALPHIGHLVAGLTIGGYMAMTAKDIAKGWEPRVPDDYRSLAKIIGAAMVQGGGAGIYGDFLFGEANRFGNGPLETAAGPAIGAAAGLISIWQRLKEGDMKAADAFNWSLQNTPFLNLWYTRPALNVLFLNAMHESLSPGYLRRQERNRKRDYGQDRLWPASVW